MVTVVRVWVHLFYCRTNTVWLCWTSECGVQAALWQWCYLTWSSALRAKGLSTLWWSVECRPRAFSVCVCIYAPSMHTHSHTEMCLLCMKKHLCPIPFLYIIFHKCKDTLQLLLGFLVKGHLIPWKTEVGHSQLLIIVGVNGSILVLSSLNGR